MKQIWIRALPLVLILSLAGCLGKEPPNKLLWNFLEIKLEIKAPLAIKSVDPDWIANGENAYEGKVKVTFVMQEPLYERASLKDAQVAADAFKPEDELLLQAKQRAAELPGPQRSAVMEKAPDSSLNSWNFIKLVTKAGQTSEVNFRIKAKKGANDGWEFEIVQVDDGERARADFKGKPRKEFSDEAKEVGSDATRDALKKYNDDIKAFAKAVDQALVDAKKAKAEALEKKRAEIFALLKPGAIFWGTVEFPGEPPHTVGLILDKADASGNVFPARLLVPDDFPDSPPVSLSIKKDLDTEFPITLSLPKDVNIELALKDGGLTGSRNDEHGREGRFTFAPITEDQLKQQKEDAAGRIAARKAAEAEQLKKAQEAEAERLRLQKEAEAEIQRQAAEAEAQRQAAEAERIKQEKEAEAQRQAAAKQHETEYAAALKKALAPGSAFKGNWQRPGYNENYGIAFALTEVDEKGLSAKGFLFDPLEIGNRRPFTATINRAVDADNALVLQTTGVGLYDPPTPLQREWLQKDSSYNLTLHLTAEGHWAGNRSGNDRQNYNFSPIPGFAEQLQAEAEKRQAEEKKRQERRAALEKATAAGSTWFVTATYDNTADVIGLYFEKNMGDILTGRFFDPKDPERSKEFSGSRFPDQDKAMLTATAGSGDDKDGCWLFSGQKYGVTLDADGRGTRKTDGHDNPRIGECRYNTYNDVPLRFSPSPDSYPALVAKKKGLPPPAPAAPAPAPVVAAPAPVAPAPVASAPAPVASAPSTAASAPAASAFPALKPKADGKPVAAAHRVSLEGKTARLAVQALAPGKTLTAVRIDNFGGIASAWRSDGKDGAAPLQVLANGKELNAGAAAMSAAMGQEEQRFDLVFTDNGALAGGATDLRITLFFADNTRAMCLLAHK